MTMKNTVYWLTCSHHTVLVVEENQNGIQRSILKRVRLTLQQPDVVTPMAPQMSSAAPQILSQMLPQYTLLQGSPCILAPLPSAHLPFQTPLGIQQLQVTPSSPISHCIAMQVPPPVPPIGPALLQQAPAPSWNAGMSPNAYEVVVTPAKVQKWYGCGNDFSPM